MAQCARHRILLSLPLISTKSTVFIVFYEARLAHERPLLVREQLLVFELPPPLQTSRGPDNDQWILYQARLVCLGLQSISLEFIEKYWDNITKLN